jgi:hypothetical protein
MVLAKGFFAGMIVMAATLFPATAQSPADIPGPAELPPEDYADISYVDSRGCVFLRAGYGGRETWVPRVTKDRKLLCGYAPTPVTSTRPAPVSPPPAEVARVDAPAVPAPPAVVEAPATEPVVAPAPAVVAPPPPVASAPEPPKPKAAPAVAKPKPARPARTAPRKTVMSALPTGGHYVQVGAYAVPANADAARARLRAMGLPTARADVRQGGRVVRIVLVGPITAADGRAAALRTVREAGFGDAFIR